LQKTSKYQLRLSKGGTSLRDNVIKKGIMVKKSSFAAITQGTDSHPVPQQDEDNPSNGFVRKPKEELFSS